MDLIQVQGSIDDDQPWQRRRASLNLTVYRNNKRLLHAEAVELLTLGETNQTHGLKSSID